MIADPILTGTRYRFGITIGGFPFGKYWTLGGFTDDLAKNGWSDIVARGRLPSDPDPIGSSRWESLVEATRTGPTEASSGSGPTFSTFGLPVDPVFQDVDLYWSMAIVTPGIAAAATAAAKAACDSVGGVWDSNTSRCTMAGVPQSSVPQPQPFPIPQPLQPQPQVSSTTTWLIIGVAAVVGLWFVRRK